MSTEKQDNSQRKLSETERAAEIVAFLKEQGITNEACAYAVLINAAVQFKGAGALFVWAAEQKLLLNGRL